jgi:RND family efflux transporter MFP subunit
MLNLLRRALVIYRRRPLEFRLVPALAGFVFALAGTTGRAQPPVGATAAPVRVDVVQEREITTGRSFVGTVVAHRTSTVSSRVEGVVEELYVRRGDHVEEKQPLAQLRTVSLEIQKAGAQAELTLRRHELDELTKTAPKEIEQAEARMLASKALKEFTEARAKRTQDLLLDNAVSRDELQDNLSAAEAAAQRYLETKAAYELANSGKWDEQIAQASAKVAIQEEVIRGLEDDIAEHTIVAPFEGYVTEKRTEVGQWLAKGDPVVDVIDLQHVEVEVPVLENYVVQLREGATSARVEFSAFPGKSFPATVVAVIRQADDRSRSFPVKVRLLEDPESDDAEMPMPGMFARVTLPVGNREAALLVHKDALDLGEDSTIVWVVQPDRKAGSSNKQGTVRPVPVELGIADGEMIEVRGPLKPGELVIVEGNERVNPTVPVLMTNYPAVSNTRRD